MRSHKAKGGRGKVHGSDLRKQLKKRKRKRESERRLRDDIVTSKYGQKAHDMCGRKMRYVSESEALRVALISLRKNDATMLRAYRCPYCNGWHLTSKDKS